MSTTTVKIVAAEILAKVRIQMQKTPSSWASALEERVHARQYGQTLRYLQTCYSQVRHVLPPNLNAHTAEQLQELFKGLHDVFDSCVDHVSELLEEPENHLMTVPKYYYSELRHRRNCVVPQPPDAFAEENALSFLAIEAVGCLRNAERFNLLATERGTDVPQEAWKTLGKDASGVARDIVTSMVTIFGEHKTMQVLSACAREEKLVCTQMLDRGSAPEAEEDEEEDEDGVCSVETKPIFVVSDCTGESAERTVLCSLGQFEHCFERYCPADITTFRFCNVNMIDGIVKSAQERKAFIVFTLVDPIVNAKMVECCAKQGVLSFDLWSQLLERLEGYFAASRLGIPGRRQFADERYMEMIECIEYTRTVDDGVQPHRWLEADLMIVGPSRSGKTPLAFFMAQRGFKVANYPLVPDEPIPRELWQIDQRRVFALDIDSSKLSSIREARMRTLRMGARTGYANLSTIRKELDWCHQLYRKNPRWTVLDTSDAGIEENCAKILMAVDELGGSRFANAAKLQHPSVA